MKKRASVFLLIVVMIFLFSSHTLAESAYKSLWPRIDGSTATIPLTQAIISFQENIDSESAARLFVHHKTGVAYDALVEGDADLIFVTPPDNEAIWGLCGSNDDIDPWDEDFALTLADVIDYEFVPVVRDALVFLNNVENPVEGLTLEQLQEIYQGKVTNWKDVGGEDAEITAYQRPSSAGSQALFSSLLMGKKVAMEPPKDWVIGTMGFLVDEVANYKNAKNALGYSVYFYVTDMYGSEKIRLLAVDGIKPTKQSIATETYPLGTYYYAVFRKDLLPDHPARKLVQWLLTDEGQKLAQNAGYVPLRPLQ